MALIKCPECGKNISDELKSCIYCGYKLKNNNIKENRNLKFICIILFFSLVLFLMAFIFMFLNYQKERKPNISLNNLKKSVVYIKIFNENEEFIKYGSGVVAFKNNIILTNAHVIEDNTRIEIITEDNKKYNVQGVLDYNKNKDIAILKIDNSSDLKPLKIKPKKVDVGQKVIAIGSPLGVKNTVSDGIISGIVDEETTLSYQHTAPISPGSSGGALLDKKGNLIGINYASAEGGQNLNFSVPINYFEKEYNIVKDNVPIQSKYFDYLNSKILRTRNGSELLNFVFNDKYSNNKEKSGKFDEDEYRKGDIYICRNLGKCYAQFSNMEFSEISEYVNSSVNIRSGVKPMVGSYNTVTKEIDTSTAIEGEGYNVTIIKLNSQNETAIEKVKNFLNDYDMEDSSKDIGNKGKYVYRVICDKYDKCNEVKKIVKQIY